MSSRRRARRECRRKVGYETRDDARVAAWKCRVLYGSRLYPYRCPHCGRWHLGHRPGTIIRWLRAARREA